MKKKTENRRLFECDEWPNGGPLRSVRTRVGTYYYMAHAYIDTLFMFACVCRQAMYNNVSVQYVPKL